MVTRVEIPSFHKSLPLNETLTRHMFEELNKDLFQSALDALQNLLDENSLKPTDINDVVFTGGSSYIPLLRSQLETIFNKKHALKMAAEAVVAGAAMQAALMSGILDNEWYSPVEVHPLSLGIVLPPPVYMSPSSAFVRTAEKKLTEFTIVPTRKSVKVMVPGDQGAGSKVVIKVIEGERLHAKDNRIVGELDITSILSAPSSVDQAEVLDLTMELDSKVGEDARDNRLVDSLASDGDKHWDVEYPLMQQYTKIVDLQSFALAAKNEALTKMVLPEAVRGLDDSMRKVLKAAESALAWRLDEESIVSPIDQIEDAKFNVERIRNSFTEAYLILTTMSDSDDTEASAFDAVSPGSDLDSLIDSFERMVDEHPEDSETRATLLSSLAKFYYQRFALGEDDTDLNNAIEAFQEADEISKDETNRASSLGILGQLLHRSTRTGEVSDIDAAIDVLRVVIDIDTDPQTRPSYLGSLGQSLRDKYNKSGGRCHLEEAIQRTKEAAQTSA
ncbi:Heat shock protein sks2, partial [Apiospora saccharicola]